MPEVESILSIKVFCHRLLHAGALLGTVVINYNNSTGRKPRSEVVKTIKCRAIYVYIDVDQTEGHISEAQDRVRELALMNFQSCES